MSEDRDLSSYSTSELEKLTADEARRLHEAELAGRFLLYRPTWYQEDWWSCTKPLVAILCANRVGKTEFLATKALQEWSGWMPYWFTGVIPTDIPDLRGKKVLIAANDLKNNIPQTIIPKLNKYMMPEMLAEEPIPGAHGYPLSWKAQSGALMFLRSYEQGRKAFEGMDVDVVFLDEPPPWEIYVAIRRGMMDRGGRLYITATPIDQPWMRDHFQVPALDPTNPRHDEIAIFTADTEDNCLEHCAEQGKVGYIPHAEIEKFAGELPEGERQARLHGKFLDYQGLEFREWEPEKHIVPDFEIPRDWPYVEVVDPSYTRGFYVIWAAVDPDDDWYVVNAEHVMQESFGAAVERIKYVRDATFGRGPALAIMDARGGGHLTNVEQKRDWFDSFAEYGIQYVPSKETPYHQLHEWMAVRWSPKKQIQIPKLRFTSRVLKVYHGPCWAFENFIWGEKIKENRKKLEGQEGKDYIDVCRYLSGHPESHYSLLMGNAAREESGLAESYRIGPPKGLATQIGKAFPKMRRESRGPLIYPGRRSGSRLRGRYY